MLSPALPLHRGFLCHVIIFALIRVIETEAERPELRSVEWSSWRGTTEWICFFRFKRRDRKLADAERTFVA